MRKWADRARESAFERLPGLKPGDAHALLELRTRVDPAVRAATGALHLVRPGDLLTGPGAGLVMSSFTFPGRGGRFSRPDVEGAYYCAQAEETAIAETVHHQTAALRASARGPVTIPMRLVRADLVGKLHDLRGWRASHPALYDPDDYTAGRLLGARLREAAGDGALFASVRHDGGTCAAVFRPRVLSEPRLTTAYEYRWDGARIEVRRVAGRGRAARDA